MWLSPQLAVMTVSSSWGVWHCLAWQVTVRAQASSCPARAPRPLCPISAGRVPAGCPRERGGRKELLSLIVPGSAGSDNSSFLPHASGPAVGPTGQGCSHGTTAWCGADMVVWCWHSGWPSPLLLCPGLLVIPGDVVGGCFMDSLLSSAHHQDFSRLAALHTVDAL